ncbi:SGNH/GDSL hydrolase family protein [Pseudooceanicola sp.]|uniref:SGNH/GDSL hydrolase family protein n=1 Tax=Pseudooceanicola sp. TaxID=1914328 RepID=UPI0035C71271
MIRIIALNIMIFCAMMFLLLITPPTAHAIKSLFRTETPDHMTVAAATPALRDFDWALQSLRESLAISLSYNDFVVQRSEDSVGGTVNVTDGVRHTVGDPRDGAGGPVWFFGGSTTWGAGVHDAFTYPSIFAQRTGRPVTNYGERAYTSRQSLAYLQGLYLTKPEGPRTIVFYDGINDVAQGCVTQTYSINQTAMQTRFRATLDALETSPSYRHLFAELRIFAAQVALRLGLVEPTVVKYACSDDPERAAQVAAGLVTIWQHAQRLAEANGDTFLGVLQPVSFTREEDAPVLPEHPYYNQLLSEYRTVYPLIQIALTASDLPYIDLSHVFDNCPECYYDHVHVGPAAHEKLVDDLARVVP